MPHLTCYTLAALSAHAAARAAGGLAKGVFGMVAVGIPVGISTFRGRVGTDYDNLVASMWGTAGFDWSNYSPGYVAERFSRLEVAYQWCLFESYRRGMDAPYVLYGIASVVAVAAFLAACRVMRVSHVGALYFGYLCVVFSVQICNPAQGAAVSLTLLAVCEASRCRWFRYAVASGLAVVFHLSGAVVLFVVPVLWLDKVASKKTVKFWPAWVLFAVAVAVAAVRVSVAVVDAVPGLSEYTQYVDSAPVRLANGVFAFVAAFVIAAPALWRGFRAETIPPLAFLAALTALVGIAFSFPLLSHPLRRTAFYFLPLSVVMSCGSSLVSTRARPFPARAVCVFAVFYFIVVYAVFSQTYRIIPYLFFWEE